MLDATIEYDERKHMRIFDAKNPKGRDPHAGNGKSTPSGPSCPECGGKNGSHNRVRFSKPRLPQGRTARQQYDIVWEDCPRK